jgi:FtsP/CotA-like multicopper oxidase with cupredoxin domain
VDEGWKDTALVMPGERVRVLMRFEHYPGLFLYHCHNLEHEDMGMMRNYLIKA